MSNERWTQANFYSLITPQLVDDHPAIKIIKAFVKYYECQERCKNELVNSVNKIYDDLNPGEVQS